MTSPDQPSTGYTYAQAGVSIMTVSKVMRDEPDISAATKVRVRALATT